MTNRLRVWSMLVIGVLLFSSAAGAAAAPARDPANAPAVFTVNSTNDVVADFTNDPGFTVCRTALANSTCTLRAAVMNGNRHAGGAIIHVPAGTYLLSLPPASPFDDSSGNLDITSTVSVVGAGAPATILDGVGAVNLFLVQPAGVLTLTGVTLQNGRNAAGFGGAIDDEGQLSLTDSVLRGNFAQDGGGGLFVFITATAALDRVTVANNARDGIQNQGHLTLSHSTVSGNVADGAGGGIVNINTGLMTVFNSTISNNRAKYSAGGIHNLGRANILAATIAGNLADDQAAGGQYGGGIVNDSSGTVELANTLLVGNYVSSTLSACSGVFDSQDYNLIESVTGCTLTGVTAHNNASAFYPFVAELADNGGGTLTRALFTHSPALDQIPAGSNGPCRDPFGSAPVPDQRGVARPVNGLCDIGAYEGELARPFFGSNLILNGDAEASAGSPTGAWVGGPAWFDIAGQFTVVPYNSPGGFPAVGGGEQVPANHGTNLFAGGTAPFSRALQIIDLRPISGLLDTGRVSFELSADMGGVTNQEDNAIVSGEFVDKSSISIGLLPAIGPVTAADRHNQTGLLHRFASGAVPAGTRFIRVFVTLTRVFAGGQYNDGYADNISLLLTPPPLYLPLVQK